MQRGLFRIDPRYFLTRVLSRLGQHVFFLGTFGGYPLFLGDPLTPSFLFAAACVAAVCVPDAEAAATNCSWAVAARRSFIALWVACVGLALGVPCMPPTLRALGATLPPVSATAFVVGTLLVATAALAGRCSQVPATAAVPAATP